MYGVQETVPCQWCATPTTYTGTKECNDCHEIRMRCGNNWTATFKIIAAEFEERNTT